MNKKRDDHTTYATFHEHRYENIIACVKKYYTSGTVLDVGSFPFHITTRLCAENIPTIGLDRDPMRRSEYIIQHALTIKKCNIEIESFPIGDQKFSVIIFTEVLEHLGTDPLLPLHNIRNALTDTGHVIITTPNLYSLKNLKNFITGKGFGSPYNEYTKLKALGHMGHIREYAYHELQEILKKTGFVIVEHSYDDPMIVVRSKAKILCITMILKIFPFLKPYQTIICTKS